jgi:type II secretory pathway pseudopilin PulG
MKKKFAFTLAEILITIGVVGIVAAITIPSLISKYQKKIMGNRLKQTHAMLTNVIRMSEEENGFLTNDEIKNGVNLYSNDTKGFFKKYFVLYMAGASYIIYDAKNQGRWDLRQPNKTYVGFNFGKGAYCTKNGVCFYFVNHANAYSYLLVDLNGPSGPNIVGHDVFYFALQFNNKKGAYLDGKVYTVNQNSTEDFLYNNMRQDTGGCNRLNTGWANGSFCTEIVIRNGWKIPDDSRYPW